MNPRAFLPAVLLAPALLTGCVSHEPRIQLPTKVEANCENRAVKQTAIEAIVASVDDTVRPGVYPGDAKLRTVIKSLGGAFASWPGQPVTFPDTAKALGAPSPHLDLVRVVVTNQINKEEHWRPIWLTFKTDRGERTVLERAYDIQNVCVEGQIES